MEIPAANGMTNIRLVPAGLAIQARRVRASVTLERERLDQDLLHVCAGRVNSALMISGEAIT